MQDLHIPVLKNEIMEFFRQSCIPMKRVLDGTFGRGGHSKALFEAFEDIEIIAFDQDLEAINYGKERFSEELTKGKIRFYHVNFATLEDIDFMNKLGKFDGILLDLGVSSPQLDTPDRGFSFLHDGPLDMRMNKNQSVTAAEIVNNWNESDLLNLFWKKGEIRKPRKAVAKIISSRKENAIITTKQLSDLIEKTEGWRKKGQHPATKYFMALRLEVNQELEIVENSIEPAIKALNFGGRLQVITFHSSEDRIVKFRMRELSQLGKRVNKKVIIPTKEEIEKNPRSRSAKLRVFERSEV